jgi:hypothetical protein
MAAADRIPPAAQRGGFIVDHPLDDDDKPVFPNWAVGGPLQGTFGVIQGTFGVIQGTFGVIQCETYYLPSGSPSLLFVFVVTDGFDIRILPNLGNIQSTLGNIQSSLRNIRSTWVSKQSCGKRRDVRGTFGEHL